MIDTRVFTAFQCFQQAPAVYHVTAQRPRSITPCSNTTQPPLPTPRPSAATLGGAYGGRSLQVGRDIEITVDGVEF